MINVGINGFGRIGRAIFRINLKQNAFRVVAINDANPSVDNLAYMLKYDSTYGVLDVDVNNSKTSLLINKEGPIEIYNKQCISEVPWEKHDVDVVIDASGVHENLLHKKELKEKGIKYQVVTNTPDSDEIDKYIIMGVNEDRLFDEESFLISSSICDANAVAPVLNILNNEFEIDHGFLTTLHPWLSYQNLLDGPPRSFAYPGTIIDNFTLGRASINALIPKTTSALRASAKVLDFFNDKFQSLSFRVPTSIVSTADISVKLKKNFDKKDIINMFIEEEKKQKFNIVKNNTDPLISTDFIRSDYSAIIDHRWTQSNDSNYLKLILWYDNEWGYSCRVVDLIKIVSEAR
ncbi:MAG: aldehyde dehydrogenase [Bacteroidetes bacterium]|nr:aldehyde dehydrogenase [Bacteroidota bacterium]